ncbi:MAG TPA: biosynthetic peptidoglycan transglycosylase [Gemmatimonadales bacterium]|nr:biosynthetic peptidoglycan transglycosylase [Gemmatimonadales bacterium]
MTIGVKRRVAGRITRGLLIAALGWLVGVWPPPVWWSDHWPVESAMMRRRGAPVRYRPVPLEQLPPVLQRTVIIGEDSRFRTHHGLDFEEIRDALGLDQQAGFGATMRTIWRRRDRLRGASTITQQLAKNLYLSPSRNPLRKVKEALTALRLEWMLSKDRILELYLNLVELGPGLWGAPAASAHYFGVMPAQLSEAQAAALAATLPFPLSSNPAYRSGRMLHRRDLILARYHGVDVYIPPEEEFDTVPVPPFLPPIIPPVLDSLLRDTVTVPVESTPPDTVAPPDTLPDSTRDTAPQSTRRKGITSAK